MAGNHQIFYFVLHFVLQNLKIVLYVVPLKLNGQIEFFHLHMKCVG